MSDGGILSPIQDLLFGKDDFKVPEVEAPAPPAPSRKQDTGANVRVGTDAAERARDKRVGSKGKASSTLSSLSVLGAGSGLAV